MDRNEKAWRAGLAAGAAWAAAAPAERFKQIISELTRHEEEGVSLGERPDTADALGLLAGVLAEITPPNMPDCDHEYFPAGVRSGLLLAWKKRHPPAAQPTLAPAR